MYIEKNIKEIIELEKELSSKVDYLFFRVNRLKESIAKRGLLINFDYNSVDKCIDIYLNDASVIKYFNHKKVLIQNFNFQFNSIEDYECHNKYVKNKYNLIMTEEYQILVCGNIEYFNKLSNECEYIEKQIESLKRETIYHINNDKTKNCFALLSNLLKNTTTDYTTEIYNLFKDYYKRNVVAYETKR